MRFHVVSLPHTQTDGNFESCAYTNKVMGFAKMMMDRQHEVFLYSGSRNTVSVTEHIPLISETARKKIVGSDHYTKAPFDSSLPHWQKFNTKAVAEITARADQKDFVCLIGGNAQKPIADALPHMMAVEFGIGYEGTFSRYRVFESYAWMHWIYGATGVKDGRWYDVVIPGYLDPERYTFEKTPAYYYLYMGRIIDRKGVHVAAQAAQAAEVPLLIAGPKSDDLPSYGKYIGEVSGEKKIMLLQQAKAVLMPTLYIEPFGNVAIEAMTVGTPVISTDWGAFTETIRPGFTGFRPRDLGEYVEAIHKAPELYREAISKYARSRWGHNVVGARYEKYFKRLGKLWQPEGWNTI